MKREKIESIKLELEKIKIAYNLELESIRQINWMKVTMLIGFLFIVLQIISKYLNVFQLAWFILGFALYLLLLLNIGVYNQNLIIYGKPKKGLDRIFYFLFLHFRFIKKGMLERYENRIDRLIKRIRKIKKD